MLVRYKRPVEDAQMALTFYFLLNFFLSFSYTLLFPKFALWDDLHMILQPEKKTRPETGSGCGSYGPSIKWVRVV